MVCLLVVGVPKGYPALVCVGEVGFLEVAVDEVRIPEVACTKVRVVEVTVPEVTVQRIYTDEIGVGQVRTAEVAPYHLAARKDGVPAGDVVETAPFKEAEVKEAGDEGALGKVDIPEGAPRHVRRDEPLLGDGEVLELPSGEGEVQHILLPEQGGDAGAVQLILVRAVAKAEGPFSADVGIACRVRARGEVKHRVTVSNLRELSRWALC